MPKYRCVGCGKIHFDNDYSKEDGDILLNDDKTEIRRRFLYWFLGRFYTDDSMTTDNYDEIVDKIEEITSLKSDKEKKE